MKQGVYLTSQAEQQMDEMLVRGFVAEHADAVALLDKISPAGCLKFGKPIGMTPGGPTLKVKPRRASKVRMIVAMQGDDEVLVLGLGLRA